MAAPFLHNDLEAIRLRDLTRVEPGAIERYNEQEDARVEAFIASHPGLVDEWVLSDVRPATREEADELVRLGYLDPAEITHA